MARLFPAAGHLATGPTPEAASDEDALECVLAFAFGFRHGPGMRLPGTSNEALAACVDQLPATAHRIVQEEIPTAGTSVGPETRLPSTRRDGGYVDTHLIAVEMAQIVHRQGYRRVGVVAHPGHLPRVMRTLAVLGVPARPVTAATVPYDVKSAQWWTRGPIRWHTREAISRLLYRLRGWT